MHSGVTYLKLPGTADFAALLQCTVMFFKIGPESMVYFTMDGRVWSVWENPASKKSTRQDHLDHSTAKF